MTRPLATEPTPRRRARVLGSPLARAAVGIGAVTVVARAVGFARGLVFVRTVGATCVGDTYYAANTVPNIIFEVVAGGALASAIVPVLAGPAADGDVERVRRTASALLTWVVLLLVPVAVLGAVLAHPLLGLLAGSAPGRPAAAALGARMLVVFMPQVVLYGVGIVLTGVLQAHRRFLGPAVAPLLSSIVVIAAYVGYAATGPAVLGCAALPRGRELVLSVGTTLGVAALTLGMFVPLRRAGVVVRPALRFPPATARRLAALAAAGVAALVAQQLANAVVLRLSYGGPAGTLVLYNLAWSMFLLPWAVLAVPVATTAFPTLAASAEAGDEATFARTVAAATRTVVAVSLGAAALLVATARPMARLLVLHAAGRPDPAVLAVAVAAFAPGLLGYGLVAHLGRALYARHRGRPAAVATVTGWAVVAAVDVALGTGWPAARRLLALALGNTAGMLVAGVLLTVAMRRAAGSPALAGAGRALAGAAVGAAVAAGVGWLAAHQLPAAGIGGSLAQAAGVGLLAAAVFAAIGWPLGVLARPAGGLRLLRGAIRG